MVLAKMLFVSVLATDFLTVDVWERAAAAATFVASFIDMSPYQSDGA